MIAELAQAVSELVRRGKMSLPRMLDECERLIITEALGRARGTHAELAQSLGITRRTFYNKLRKYGLPTAR